MTLLKTSDNQTFYDWKTLAAAWIKNENEFDTDFPSKPQDEGTSLAAHIIENIFELDLEFSSQDIGGYLPGYDVKNRDAYKMIQMSLAEYLKNKKMYECYAQEDGEIKFYQIGGPGNSSNINFDVLYQIDGIEMKQKCEHVMVIKYDPPFKRYTRGPYDLFKFSQHYVNNADVTTETSSDYDPYWNQYPFYYALGHILGQQACEYYKEAYIEYGNPHLNDESKLSGNDPGNDLGNAIYYHKHFEKIIGWMYVVDMGALFEQGSTEVALQQKAPRYYALNDFGNLQQRQWESGERYQPQVCRDLNREYVELADVGVHLPDSDLPKFLGVREVYIYGYELKEIAIDEYQDEDGNLTDVPADFVVSLDTMILAPIKLSQGEDYIVVKDTENGLGRGGRYKYKIVFSCNVSPNYIEKFGGLISTVGNASFRVANTSIFGEYDPSTGEFAIPVCESQDFFGLEDECEGVLKDGKTEVESSDIFYASIFPMGEGNSGYAMPESIAGTDNVTRNGKIVVVYDWDNPCLRVLDQKNQATSANLANVSINLYAIIGKDLEPPIAITSNGQPEMLDPRQKIPDSDLTTIDTLGSTRYQQAMEGLENGDIKITLPFISCDGDPWDPCQELMDISEFIYDMQNDKVKTTTYICDPNAEPVLGQTIDGKIINSIDYSYQDSSQYLISVQAGPRWQGNGGWDQSVYQNKVERIQVEGVVRSLYSDGRCLVDIERMGLLECVNGQVEPLEIGDTVRITMFNNPISI